MSRVVAGGHRRTLQAIVVPLSAALLAASATSAAAQPPPACGDGRASDCVLPGWSTTDASGIPSPFGEVEGVVWVEDEEGDAPEGGLDILAAGVGTVTIEDPRPIRTSDGLIKRGKAKQAVPAGESALVRIVLDRPPSEVEGGHASVHLATDDDGSRSNNVPSGVSAPDFPFAGSQDAYSLTWASTTGKTRLLASDLAKDWYRAKGRFAASWAAPNVLDLLIRPKALGDGFRVVTHAAGRTGGYDTLSWGPAPIPADGRVGLVPACIEGSIATEPFEIRRLVEDGQTVRNVNAQASWRGGASVPVDDAVRTALDGLLGELDDDGDGRVGISAWVNLFENGSIVRQRSELTLGLEADQAVLGLELGLTRRGYNVLRNIQPEATGDPVLDEWLKRATDALRETMPPFRLGKNDGLLVGEAIGACVRWIEPLPEPSPSPTASPAAEAASTT